MPGADTFFESSVIELALVVELTLKRQLLANGWVKTIAEGSASSHEKNLEAGCDMGFARAVGFLRAYS